MPSASVCVDVCVCVLGAVVRRAFAASVYVGAGGFTVCVRVGDTVCVLYSPQVTPPELSVHSNTLYWVAKQQSENLTGVGCE